jgi:hypothetical protein
LTLRPVARPKSAPTELALPSAELAGDSRQLAEGNIPPSHLPTFPLRRRRPTSPPSTSPPSHLPTPPQAAHLPTSFTHKAAGCRFYARAPLPFSPQALAEAARSGALAGAGWGQAAHLPAFPPSHLSAAFGGVDRGQSAVGRGHLPTFPLSHPSTSLPSHPSTSLPSHPSYLPTSPPSHLPTSTFPLSHSAAGGPPPHLPTFSLRRRRPTFPPPLRTKRQDAASTPGPRCPFRRRRLLKQRAPGPSPERAGGRRPTFPLSHLPTFPPPLAELTGDSRQLAEGNIPPSHLPTFSLRRRRPTFPPSHFLTPPQAAHLPTFPLSHSAAGGPPSHLPTFSLRRRRPTFPPPLRTKRQDAASTPGPRCPFRRRRLLKQRAPGPSAEQAEGRRPTFPPSHFLTPPQAAHLPTFLPSHLLYAQSGRMPLLRQGPAALFAAGAC